MKTSPLLTQLSQQVTATPHLRRINNMTNALDYINALTALVAACSAITALTPTPKDDKIVGKLYKFLEVFALVIGKAKK
jgi:hypothetical protein